LILAEVALSIRVTQRKAPESLTRVPSETSSAHRFRKIFASYSHKDLQIVKEMERCALSLGDRYLIDSLYLRAGERWAEGLLGKIAEADIFQLFWSWNSSQSPYVEREWRHALSLRREMFIRPTYWEDPWPDPPEALRPIHFQRNDIGTAPAPPAPLENIRERIGTVERELKAYPQSTPPPAVSLGIPAPHKGTHKGRKALLLIVLIVLLVLLVFGFLVSGWLMR
jgi:hypothetical protein